MALPIPQIDDRRYADLVRALLSELPQLSLSREATDDEPGFGAWSDHNASQTGVAVMELLAAMGEMILYRCDYIDEEVESNFLRLVVDRPEPVTARVAFLRATPSVPLAALPGAGVLPPELAGRAVFTGTTLEFHGLMSAPERDLLFAVDPNPPPTAYTDAVERLYLRSIRVVQIPAGTQLGTPTGERFETVEPETIPAGGSGVNATVRHLAADAPFDLQVDGTNVVTTGVAGERFALPTRGLGPPPWVRPILLEPLSARTLTYNPNPRITVTPPAAPAEDWEYVPDFLEAGDQAVFTVDRVTYELVLGDGTRGRIPPAGSGIRIEHLQRVHGPEVQASAAQLDRILETTAGLATDPLLGAGNTTYDPRRGRLVQTALMTELQRTALLAASAVPGFPEAVEALFELSNLTIAVPADQPASVGILATGGRYLFDGQNAETAGLAALREEDRAITTRDFEDRMERRFNGEIPDAPRVAKAHARRLDDRGTILVIVLPEPTLVDRWPVTTPELRARAQLYLDARRLITTRVIIRSPIYVRFDVEVELLTDPGVDANVLRQRAIDGVVELFDPFVGGVVGAGWPAGRAIHRSEIFERLHQTEGVGQVPLLRLLHAGASVSSIDLRSDELPRLDPTAIQVRVIG